MLSKIGGSFFFFFFLIDVTIPKLRQVNANRKVGVQNTRNRILDGVRILRSRIQCVSERVAFSLGNGPLFSLLKEEKEELMDEDDVKGVVSEAATSC